MPLSNPNVSNGVAIVGRGFSCNAHVQLGDDADVMVNSWYVGIAFDNQTEYTGEYELQPERTYTTEYFDEEHDATEFNLRVQELLTEAPSEVSQKEIRDRFDCLWKQLVVFLY